MYADGEMLLGRPGLSCTPSDTSSSSGFTEARPVSSVEGDALWLVSSYLASRPECAALSAQLNAILERESMLGSRVSWDGSTRPASVRDIRSRHPNMPPNKLVTLLERTAEALRGKDVFKSGSLLAPEADAEAEELLRSPDGGAQALSSLARTLIDSYHKSPEAMFDTALERCTRLLSSCLIGPSHEVGAPIAAGIHMLNAREAGLGSFAGCGVYSLFRGSAQSFNDFHTRLSNRYRFHWRTSGHLTSPAYCVAFDYSGRFLITGADDALVKIWDVEAGLLLRTCRGHSGCIVHIAVSPDNSMFATCCTFGRVRIWNLTDGKCLSAFRSPGDVCINWIMFDATSTAFVIVGDDGVCMVLDLLEKIMLSGDGASVSPTVSLVMQYREKMQPKGEVSNEEEGKHHDPRHKLLMNSQNERLLRTVCLNIDPQYALPWTNNLDTFGGQLNLSHASGQRRRIVALDICPLDRIIVTGCDDGLAQLWRYGERMRDASKVELGPGGENAAISTRHTKSFFDQIGGVGEGLDSRFHAICRLEGHVCAVMDTRFSHSGDRVITGSMDDGTVRLWSFSSDFTKTEHILISLSDDDEDGASAPSGGVSASGPFRGRPNNRMNRAKRVLYSLCWSNNDAYILALYSISAARDDKIAPSRLKLFDSLSGNLIQTISISGHRTELLYPHPINPNIAVTAGSDGTIVVWDVITGDALDRHELVTPEITDFPEGMDADTKVEVADGCFSSDGDKFAVTDNFGRLSLFGLGEVPSKYSGKYPEQYFSTDYHALLFEPEGDPRGYDAGTHELLNDAPPGPLCRYDGTPYEDQPTNKLFNVSIDASATMKHYYDLIEASKNFDKLLEKSHNALVKLKLKMGTSSQQMLTRNSWNTTQFGSNIRTIQSVGASDLARNRSQSQASQGRRSVYIDPSSESDESFEEITQSQNRGDCSQRAAERASRLQGRRRNNGRARMVQSESDEDEDESFVSVSDGEYHDRSGSSTSDEDKAIVSDSEVSNEDDYIIPSEGGGSKPRASKRLKASSKNAKSKNASSNKNKASKITTKNKAKQVIAAKDTLRPWGSLNGFRTVPIGTTVDRLWLQQDEPNDLHYCPQCGDSVMYIPQGHLEHLHGFPEASAPPWLSFALKWPVVECKILNIAYDFPSHQEYKYCTSVIARISLIVTGVPIKYVPTGSVPAGNDAFMWREFGQLRSTRHSAQRNEISFEVSLRSCSAPDFLIPSHLYRRAASIRWRPGLRFKTYFKEDNGGSNAQQRLQQASPGRPHISSLGPVIGAFSSQMTVYSGKVVHVRESNNSEWPRSPWESLVVIWTARNSDVISWNEAEDEANAQDRISPWDAYLAAIGDESSSSSSSGSAALLCQSQLPDKVERSVLDAIDELLNGDDAATYAPFSVPVDPELFTDYYCLIPLPMDLSTIRKRIQNKFYRQVEGLQSDISLICSNCMQYNREDAPIVPLAQKLTSTLLSVIENCVGDRPEASSSTQRDAIAPTITPEADEEPQSPPGASMTIHLGRMPSTRTSRRGASAIEPQTSTIQAARRSVEPEPASPVRLKLRRGAKQDVAAVEEESSESERSENSVPAKRARRSLSTRGNSKKPIAASSGSEEEEQEASSSEDGSDAESDADASDSDGAKRRNRNARSTSTRSTRESRKGKTTSASVKASSRPQRSARTNAGRRYQEEDESADESEGQSQGSSDKDSDGSGGRPTRKRARNIAPARTQAVSAERKAKVATSSASVLGKTRPKKGGDLYDDILWPLYHGLVEEDPMEIFALPVTDEIAPGYSDVISRPTDLSRIKTQLEARKYRTLAQFKEEAVRMFDNCIAFNESDSVFAEEASRQRDAFEGKLVALE